MRDGIFYVPAEVVRGGSYDPKKVTLRRFRSIGRNSLDRRSGVLECGACDRHTSAIVEYVQSVA